MSELAPREQPCVYCNQDVMPPISADHADDCPSNTGIFPVLERDVKCKCPCGQVSHEGGLMCGICQAELKVGDSYAHQAISPGDPHLGRIAGAAVGLIVCLFCAATDAQSS